MKEHKLQTNPTLKLWKWGNDRFSNLGYKIFTLAYIKGIFDCYLFYYKKGSYIPKHKDPSKYGKQYRFNIVLKKPSAGGEFVCKGKHFNLWDRFIFFRADRDYHYINKITQGTRLMLSFGFYFKGAKK